MTRASYARTVVADRARVFGIASDYEGLAMHMPRHFASVRVRSRRGDVAVVEARLRMAGRELSVMTRHVTSGQELHEFRVIGGDAKGSRVTERYADAPGGTRVEVDADLRLGWAARLGGGRSVRDGLRGMVDELAAAAEG